MKLLEINVCSGCKSTGRIASDIAGLFLEQGDNEAVIAYGRGYVDRGIKTYKIGNKNDVRLDALTTRVFDNAGFNNKRKTRRFIEWVKEYDPDVIHLHNIHGYYLNVEMLFAYLKTCGKKIIWTLHDCWTFTGHCAYFDSVNCERWHDGCHHCPLKREYPASVVFDRSKKNYEQKKALFTGVPNMTLVSPSQWLADLTAQSFMGEYPIEVIPNGIDTTVFKPTAGDFRERNGLQDKTIVLGVAGPWDKRKGLCDFYEVAERLGDAYQVVLVGLTAAQIQALPANILGIARTNSTQELAEIYTAADVFANPTYSDNYPTVNLEAQMCGTPVITYRTGGSVESVPPENVVERGDIDALVARIRDGGWQIKKDLQADKQTMLTQYVALYTGV